MAVAAVLYRSRFDVVTSDPDTYMRLAVLEHQLGAGLTTYNFPRDGAPLGMQVHWTLPFDALIIALAAPLAPALGWHAALDAAAQAAPFASLAILAVALAAISRPRDTPWVIALVAVCPLVIGYALLGMVNHHVLAVALGLFAIAAALRLRRTMRPREGLWAAFWSVVAVWESLECDIPLLVATAIITAAAALRPDRGALRSFALLAPALAVLVLLLDPPPEGRMALSADRFSLLQLTMFGAIGLAPLLARRAAGHGATRIRLLRGGMAASAVLLGWAVLALALARPVRSSDPGYLLYYWQSVSELQPGWSSASLALTAATPSAVGLALAATFAWRRPRQRLIWLAITGALGMEFLAGLVSIRLATHAGALSAVLVGASLHAFIRRRTPTPGASLLTFCFAGIGSVAVAFASGLIHRDEPTCAMGPQTAAALARALPADAVVAADLWSSPEVLWRTNLRTIAGPYHRNWSGIEDLARIFRGTDDAVIRPVLGRRQARAVLICASPSNIDRDIFAPDSLARRLADGRIPGWLQPLPQPSGGNPAIRMFLLYAP